MNDHINIMKGEPKKWQSDLIFNLIITESGRLYREQINLEYTIHFVKKVGRWEYWRLYHKGRGIQYGTLNQLKKKLEAISATGKVFFT